MPVTQFILITNPLIFCLYLLIQKLFALFKALKQKLIVLDFSSFTLTLDSFIIISIFWDNSNSLDFVMCLSETLQIPNEKRYTVYVLYK